MSYLQQLQAREALAKDRKVPLDMPDDERHRLMDVLLRVMKIAGDTFDALEANAISERDVLVMLQLPDYCNSFTRGMEHHARTRLGGGGSGGKGDGT